MVLSQGREFPGKIEVGYHKDGKRIERDTPPQAIEADMLYWSGIRGKRGVVGVTNLHLPRLGRAQWPVTCKEITGSRLT